MPNIRNLSLLSPRTPIVPNANNTPKSNKSDFRSKTQNFSKLQYGCDFKTYPNKIKERDDSFENSSSSGSSQSRERRPFDNYESARQIEEQLDEGAELFNLN